MIALSTWKLAMVFLFPFLLTSWAKVRTWSALFGAAMIGEFVPADMVPVFTGIDILAAWVVLAHPKGCAQRAIGLFFVGMLAFHIGFYVASHWRPPAFEAVLTYARFERGLGWAQLACLGLWGLYDLCGLAVRRWGYPRYALANGGGA